jgi:hypothetical protein
VHAPWRHDQALFEAWVGAHLRIGLSRSHATRWPRVAAVRWRPHYRL